MTSFTSSISRHLMNRKIFSAISAASLVALGGCKSDILEVNDPDIIGVGDANTAAAATNVRNGAIRSFVDAFDGGTDVFVVVTGNLADELRASDTFDGRLLPNRRLMNDNLPEMTGVYLNLHKARVDLTEGAKTIVAVAPTLKIPAGEMYMYRGFTEDFMAEMYCSGVPFSSADASANITYGAPQTTVQVLTRAVASFDSAATFVDATAAGVALGNAIKVGKARALLNLGQYAAAAAAVAGVPTTFKLNVDHCLGTVTGCVDNGLYGAAAAGSSRYTPSKNEGINGLDFMPTVVAGSAGCATGVPAGVTVTNANYCDPRLPWVTSSRNGFNTASWPNMPVALKSCPTYRSVNLAVCSQSANSTGANVLADGIEARLIEAEARLQGGAQADRDAVFATLNQLRATAISPAVPAITTAPTTQAAAVTMLFNERAYWMYLTGHRLGDLRRLIRQYGRDAEAVFPTGEQQAPLAGPYGTDVNFPIPASEKNNPNFTGCIDRKA